MSGATNEFNQCYREEFSPTRRRAESSRWRITPPAPYTLICKADLRSIADFKGRRSAPLAPIRSCSNRSAWRSRRPTLTRPMRPCSAARSACNPGADSEPKSYTLWDVAKNVPATTIGTYHGGLLWGIMPTPGPSCRPIRMRSSRKSMPILAADVTPGYPAGKPRRSCGGRREGRQVQSARHDVEQRLFGLSQERNRAGQGREQRAGRTERRRDHRSISRADEEVGKDRRRGDPGRQAEVRRRPQPRGLQRRFRGDPNCEEAW